MKNKVITTALSLTCSAALCMSGLLPAAVPALQAYAAEAVSTVSAETAQERIVPVIVTVEGDALLANGRQAKDLLNSDISAETAAIADAQESVQNALRAIYPALDVKYSYNTLLNGFACELPEDLIDEAEALDGVVSVSIVESVIVPKMAKAPAFSGFPAYSDKTGCTGEGQVIAVIDTELDITHPMFSALADDITKTVTKEQVAEIQEKLGLNAEISAEDAYVNTKLPFAADYVDGTLANPSGYHGTHVAGIAAGNVFTDENGNTFSGIAKDAQLLFMSVGTYAQLLDITSAVAALEDAVKLGANVVNMSFGGEGESYGKDPLPAAIDTAESAGVSVVVSAGNSDNGAKTHNEVHTPENPDVSTMNNNFNGATKAMAIASADNVQSVYTRTLMLGEQKIPYSNTSVDISTIFLPDRLPANETGEYEYVYCGEGLDYTDLDVNGKIAVVDRGKPFVDLSQNACAAGAAGLIIINNKPGNVSAIMLAALDEAHICAGMVSQEDGKLLTAAENKVIRFLDDADAVVSIDIPTDVSNYTSWGVQNSLLLRPDIMGIGGFVESAAYDSGASIMSGTSMASPYVAGCTAVFNQYLEQNGCELTGSERMQFIRNLLMTSAVPYENDEMFVTPRRQGAGMISLDNALRDTVLLTGKEGESKINLFDQLGDSFTFEVTLTNIGKEDVTFSTAQLRLTTDAVKAGEDGEPDIIEGQQSLTAQADLDGVKTIKAGETRTEKITVTLDKAQTAALKNQFINGFFIEGYLLLGGAENCCDISIPMLGFSDDWTALPIFKGEGKTLYCIGSNSVESGVSLIRIADICSRIRSHMTEEELAEYEAALNAEGNSEDLLSLFMPTAVNPVELLLSYANEEELAALSAASDPALYISPNNDGIADMFAVKDGIQRNVMVDGPNVTDLNGKVLIGTGLTAPASKSSGSATGSSAEDLSELAEGEYYASISAYIMYGDAAEHPQQSKHPLIVDKTAPAMTGTIREEDGRKLLTLQINDKTLDGIVILGTSSAPDDAHSLERLGAIRETRNSAANQLLTIGRTKAVPADLPLFGKVLLGCDSESEYADYNYADVILADPDAEGNYTVEYDITNLTAYTFTAVDKALNLSVYETAAQPAESLTDGVYTGTNGLYAISGNTLTFVSFMDGAETVYKTEYTDGKLTLTDADGKQTAAEVTQVNSKILRLKGDLNDSIALTEAESTADLSFHSVAELQELLESRLADEDVSAMFGQIDITNIEPILLPNGIVTFRLMVKLGEEDPVAQEISVNLFKGTMKLMGMELPLVNEKAEELEAGNYACIDMMTGDARFMVLNEDGVSGKFVSMEDKSETPFTFELTEEGAFVFKFSDKSVSADIEVSMMGYIFTWEDGSSELVVKYSESGEPLEFMSNKELGDLAEKYEKAATGRTLPMTQVIRDLEGGLTILLDDGTDQAVYTFESDDLIGTDGFGLPVDLKNAPVMPKDGVALNRIAEMAQKDYEVKHGTAPAKAVARLCEDGTVRVFLTDAEGEALDSYTVDAVTAKGKDSKNETVDLPQTGVTDPSAALAAMGAASMLAAGAYLVLRSRRENAEA